MGIDDRDYMRDRHRLRARAGTPWFAEPERGHDYLKGRYRSRAHGHWVPPRFLALALSALLIAIPGTRELARGGWLPEFGTPVPFPPSGDVVVNAAIDPSTATSRFRVVTADANAVAQLYTLTDEHMFSVFVRRNDVVDTPVPPGRYRLKISEGQRWYGPERFFGRSMTHDTVLKEMRFTRRMSNGIDLNRRPDGNLHTRPTWHAPKFR